MITLKASLTGMMAIIGKEAAMSRETDSDRRVSGASEYPLDLFACLSGDCFYNFHVHKVLAATRFEVKE